MTTNKINVNTLKHDTWENDWYECPHCNYDSIDGSWNYCPHCGNRIYLDPDEVEEFCLA